jgi:hypothetical protein
MEGKTSRRGRRNRIKIRESNYQVGREQKPCVEPSFMFSLLGFLLGRTRQMFEGSGEFIKK